MIDMSVGLNMEDEDYQDLLCLKLFERQLCL